MFFLVNSKQLTYMHYSDAFDCRFEFVDKKRMFFGDIFVASYSDRQTWACQGNNHNYRNRQVGGNARTYHMPETIYVFKNRATKFIYKHFSSKVSMI